MACGRRVKEKVISSVKEKESSSPKPFHLVAHAELSQGAEMSIVIGRKSS